MYKRLSYVRQKLFHPQQASQITQKIFTHYFGKGHAAETERDFNVLILCTKEIILQVIYKHNNVYICILISKQTFFFNEVFSDA